MQTPYVRAASFPTAPAARAAFQSIYATCVVPDDDYEIGVVSALWNGNLPVVVAHAFATPPAEIQERIELVLRDAPRWTPPQSFIDALALRRLRQIAAESGDLQASGYRLFVDTGVYQQIDELGQNTKGSPIP